ncbi:MAG TPA: GAF domain-containing protein [Terriglobales bacterium]|nr:GAF domain-containing protein [Terriglobales bacterium]
MGDNNWIQEMVGRVVSQVLESQFPALRDELVRRVLEELQPGLEAPPQPSRRHLLQALSAVRQASGQKEILGALLDGASQFSSRAALFVVRGASVVGWQGRGFANPDDVKNFTLEASAGLCARVLEEKAPVRGTAQDLDVAFTASFGAPQDDRVILLPLLLKEKVAAVLYADAGTEGDGLLDDAALEMLVLSSGLWLEIVALRRATASQESAEAAAAPVERAEAPAIESAPPAPAPAMASVAEPVTQPMVEAVAQPEPQPEAEPEPAPMAMAAAAAAGPASIPSPVRAPASADEEALLRKARRFAKLLVDEIKLYNKPKVQEGKENRDLYQRLKEDIEKSRAAYEKRYGSTVAGSASYFDQEIVQNLADNDRSLLGDGFSR